MDEFEKRLQADAAGIEADVSPELQARIDASIHATERERSATADHGHRRSSWWASSLTGVAAALLIILLLNRNTADGPIEPPGESVVRVVPEYVLPLNSEFLLKAENAVFTEPLEDELERLKSDLEKAKTNVSRELGAAL